MVELASSIRVADVAHLLSNRRDQGKRTSLFLGSRSGGLFGNQTFYNNLQGFSLRNFAELPETDKFQECYHILKARFKERDTHAILTQSLKYIADREEDELLAGLVRARLFDVIISSNIDSLLEDTFVLAGMRRPTDYLVLNGLDNNSQQLYLTANCCTVFKIFGDIGSLKYKVPTESFNTNTKTALKRNLKNIVSDEMLVVGYDPLWDEPFEHIFPRPKAFCYVDRDFPPENSKIAKFLDTKNGTYIVGISYKRFIHELYTSVIGKPPRQRVRKTVPLPMTPPVTTKPLKQERRKIFVSYSHKDKEYLEHFRGHMTPYLGNEEDLLELWDDTKIKAGKMWDKEIKDALATTKVAVLLVSRDFFDSDYIQKRELPLLLEAAEAGEVTILSVILRYCGFSDSPLSAYQAVNDISLPLVEMREPEQARVWAKTAQRVYNIMTDADEE